MIKVYGLNGCPMCQHVSIELSSRNIEFEYIKDEKVLRDKGITHVPIVELDDGTMLYGKQIIEFMNNLKE